MLIMFAKDVQLAVCVKDKKQGANIHRLSLLTYTLGEDGARWLHTLWTARIVSASGDGEGLAR